MAENSAQFSRVDLFTNSLYPGMILNGDLFTEEGQKIYPANKPVSSDVIKLLTQKNVKKLYYNKPAAPEDAKKPLVPKEVLEKAFAVSEEIGFAVIKKAPLPEKEIENTVEQYIERISTTNKDALLNLIEIQDYDEQTYVHSVNVALMSVLFAKLLSWEPEKIKPLGIGAMLHDVGKLLIPKEILTKKEPLKPDEIEIMKKHTVYGYNLLKGQSNFSDEIIKIALLHHECIDGSGYPLGLTSDKIGELPQIVSITNFYESITNNTTFRSKTTFWKAFILIRKSMGTKFNVRYATSFINRMPVFLVDKSIFAVGNYVMLNTNEIAEIADLSKVETLKPLVKIYSDASGNPLKYPLQIDLNNEDIRWIDNIIEDEQIINKMIELKKTFEK